MDTAVQDMNLVLKEERPQTTTPIFRQVLNLASGCSLVQIVAGEIQLVARLLGSKNIVDPYPIS